MNNSPVRSSGGYSGRVVWSLVIVILLLVVFLAYLFLIGPSINGYVIDKQIEAQQILVSNIVSQIQQQGYVQIPLSEDEVLTLIPYQENPENSN
jgi:hypothetical protein